MLRRTRIIIIFFAIPLVSAFLALSPHITILGYITEKTAPRKLAAQEPQIANKPSNLPPSRLSFPLPGSFLPVRRQ